MAKVNVAHIVFRSKSVSSSSILNNEEASHRGYTSAHFENGMAIFRWATTGELMMYPIDTIKSIVATEEEE